MVNISKIEEEKNTVLKQLEQFSKNYTRTDISEEEEKNIFFSLREKLRNLEAMEYLAKTLDKPLSLKENVADIFTDPSSDNSRTVEDLVGEDFSTENSDWSLSHKKNSMPFPNDTPTTKKSNYLDNKDIPPVSGGQKINQINAKKITPTLENETNIKAIKNALYRFKNYITQGYSHPNFINLDEPRKAEIRRKNEEHIQKLKDRIDKLNSLKVVAQPVASNTPVVTTSGTLGTISLDSTYKQPIGFSLDNEQKQYYDTIQDEI
jgi:hypothetical protein